jgi:hypothetical protein
MNGFLFDSKDFIYVGVPLKLKNNIQHHNTKALAID